MTVSVFAPISVGNVSVGFDTLGLALAPVDGTLVGDIVTIEAQVEEALSHDFFLTGSHADKLPDGKENNIAWRCLLAFDRALQARAITQQKIALTLEKNIPVSSGLGSSACSVVAAFVALNLFYDQPFSDLELLRMMGELEAEISGSLHYDNVAPCFLGGLQLMLPLSYSISQTLPTFDDCYWVLAYPDIEVSTRAAREILPQQYDRQTLIRFGQNLAGFVDASHRKDKKAAFELMTDIVAEPYRVKLLPQLEQAKKSLTALGSMAMGISGSGPSIFCVSDNSEIAEACANWLTENYLQSPYGFVHICKVDHQGARQI